MDSSFLATCTYWANPSDTWQKVYHNTITMDHNDGGHVQSLSNTKSWLGHVVKMPDDRLPQKLLFGEVKSRGAPGRPRSSLNDVAVSDCQNCCTNRPCRVSQNKLLWRDNFARTYVQLIISWKA